MNKKLREARLTLEQAEGSICEQARQQHVIPFCDKTGFRFLAGMGGWSFQKADRRIDSGAESNAGLWRLPKGLRSALDAELSNGQCAGSIMRDYTPKEKS